MHQPGPWIRRDERLIDAKGKEVLFRQLTLGMSGYSEQERQAQEANTRLAEAAPELFTALRALVRMEDYRDLDDPEFAEQRRKFFDEARRAIAKAEGIYG